MAEHLPFVKIDEQTVSMTFCVNDSPFAGTEGQFVTSRHLRARLMKEVQTDVSLRVEDTETTDAFRVYGRGELHLSILIETMRRQGYEFQVTKPVVVFKEIDGEICEPIERLICDVPMEYSGNVIDKIGRRRGLLQSMHGQDRMRLEFLVPARGLFGYRSEFLTDTRGEGIMNSVFDGYEPSKGEIPSRPVGALVAWEAGETTSYALFNIQDRGELYIEPGTKVYNGMIIGRNSRPGDIDVNVCKKKHMTNSRNSASAEEALKITGVRVPTLEEAIEFIADDELVEITPKSIRMRKSVLNTEQRRKLESRKKA
jgi:GTP-binding protein